MTIANATNLVPSPGTWVVDPVIGRGHYTTITAAMAAASSGQSIFVRPGTYTENLTLKAGVDLAALDCDALTPNVTIVGKCTFTAAGTVSMSGIRLQTNSDFFLAVTGSAASIVNLKDCYLNCSNNTGISFTSSNAGAQINFSYCQGNVATTGITFYSMSSPGTISGLSSSILNTGLSTTASNNSAGSVSFRYVRFFSPVTTSSTGSIDFAYVKGATGNTTSITTAGTGSGVVAYCVLSSGTASTISIGSGTTVQVYDSTLSSSNTNAITGAGSVVYAALIFLGSATINTTTQSTLDFKTGRTTLLAGAAETNTLTIDGSLDVAGANVLLIGNGVTTPNKTIRVFNGNFEILNSAYNAAILSLSDAGSLSVSQNITATQVTMASSIVSGLPSATTNQYARRFVTDALGPVFGSIVAGSGTVKTPVWSDGTNWIVG